jgi:ferredoxin
VLVDPEKVGKVTAGAFNGPAAGRTGSSSSSRGTGDQAVAHRGGRDLDERLREIGGEKRAVADERHRAFAPKRWLLWRVQACRSCADECESHAAMHDRCRICAEACRSCEAACTELLAAIG